MSAFAKVKVHCEFCGWKGRRLQQEVQWWRDRETPTCPKCGSHPVTYARAALSPDGDDHE